MDGKALHIVLLAASVLTLVGADCALPEAVYPCTCEKKELRCGNVDEAQLRAVFAAQREHPGDNRLGIVQFEDYRMSYIPSGLLSGLDIYELNVNTSSLLSFHDPHTGKSAFAGVEKSLLFMHLNYYGILNNNFNWSSLSPLEELRNLFLSGSVPAILTPLPSLPKVQFFSLDNTGTEIITENAFADLTEIRFLYVEANLINSPVRNMFPNPARKLEAVIIYGNGVVALPEDLFEGMPVLRIVHISSNTPNVPLLHTAKATSLTVSSNNLMCDCKIKWLLRMRDEGKLVIREGVCGQPEHLRSRKLQSLTEADLNAGGSCDSS